MLLNTLELRLSCRCCQNVFIFNINVDNNMMSYVETDKVISSASRSFVIYLYNREIGSLIISL